jgi:hypothetical protein
MDNLFKFEAEKIIGEGAEGKIIKAHVAQFGGDVALKVADDINVVKDKNGMSTLAREFSLLN